MEAIDKHVESLIECALLPNQGASWQQTRVDLAMIAGLAVMERTKKWWYSILDNAELKAKEIYAYTPIIHDNITAAILM